MYSKKDPKRYNILIIEDNPGDITLIEDYILEYILAPNLVNVPSFREAKELILSTHVAKFDLIMLDLTLPDRNGTTLITEIVKLCSECPIMVLTGYTDFEFSVKSLSLGVSDYLLKDELTASSLYKSIIYNIERKKTLTELEESQKRYSNLFHLSPDPMWVYEIKSGQFLDVNAAAIREYEYSKDEFLTMNVDQLFAKEDSEIDVLHQEIYSANDKRAHVNNICRHKRKNGDVIYVESQTSEILFQSKPAQIMLSHDITQRINYIVAIEEQNKKLSEISWIQSHVVRAPIARLMGLIDLIKHPNTSEAERAEMLEYVLVSANDLDEIVREITLKAEKIDLREPGFN